MELWDPFRLSFCTKWQPGVSRELLRILSGPMHNLNDVLEISGFPGGGGEEMEFQEVPAICFCTFAPVGVSFAKAGCKFPDSGIILCYALIGTLIKAA